VCIKGHAAFSSVPPHSNHLYIQVIILSSSLLLFLLLHFVKNVFMPNQHHHIKNIIFTRKLGKGRRRPKCFWPIIPNGAMFLLLSSLQFIP
jgi:hypothetical protein